MRLQEWSYPVLNQPEIILGNNDLKGEPTTSTFYPTCFYRAFLGGEG